MIQLILHLWGDYCTQSDWMAQNKTKASWPAFCHAVIYSLPFLLLQPSWLAFSVILVTHFFIDRFRLARMLVWAKNVILSPLLFGEPRRWRFDSYTSHHEAVKKYRESKKLYRWDNCTATGYLADSPPWLSVWLMILADNTLHLTINYAALRWL